MVGAELCKNWTGPVGDLSWRSGAGCQKAQSLLLKRGGERQLFMYCLYPKWHSCPPSLASLCSGMGLGNEGGQEVRGHCSLPQALLKALPYREAGLGVKELSPEEEAGGPV